ncbi:hypothetical protein V8E36_005073 [Tilletia maclaganii]
MLPVTRRPRTGVSNTSSSSYRTPSPVGGKLAIPTPPHAPLSPSPPSTFASSLHRHPSPSPHRLPYTTAPFPNLSSPSAAKQVRLSSSTLGPISPPDSVDDGTKLMRSDFDAYMADAARRAMSTSPRTLNQFNSPSALFTPGVLTVRQPRIDAASLTPLRARTTDSRHVQHQGVPSLSPSAITYEPAAFTSSIPNRGGRIASTGTAAVQRSLPPPLFSAPTRASAIPSAAQDEHTHASERPCFNLPEPPRSRFRSSEERTALWQDQGDAQSPPAGHGHRVTQPRAAPLASTDIQAQTGGSSVYQARAAAMTRSHGGSSPSQLIRAEGSTSGPTVFPSSYRSPLSGPSHLGSSPLWEFPSRRVGSLRSPAESGILTSKAVTGPSHNCSDRHAQLPSTPSYASQATREVVVVGSSTHAQSRKPLTGSESFHSSSSPLKRLSSVAQPDPTSVQPRAYRRLGSAHGLGLHVPISGTDRVNATRTPIRMPLLDVGEVEERYWLAPIRTKAGTQSELGAPTEPKITLPRLEVLNMPRAHLQGAAHAMARSSSCLRSASMYGLSTSTFEGIRDEQEWMLSGSRNPAQSSYPAWSHDSAYYIHSPQPAISTLFGDDNDSLICSSDGETGGEAYGRFHARRHKVASIDTQQLKRSWPSQTGPAPTGHGPAQHTASARKPASSTAARRDLIQHAHQLKTFLGFAPQTLLAKRLADIPGLRVERQGGVVPSHVLSMPPEPGSIFISRPRGSQMGGTALPAGTEWTVISSPRTPAGPGHPAVRGSIAAKGHQKSASSYIGSMQSSFETFYIPHSHARSRLEKARQARMNKTVPSRSVSAGPSTATGTGNGIGSSSSLTGRRLASSSLYAMASSVPRTLTMGGGVLRGGGKYGAELGLGSSSSALPPMPIVHRFPLPTNNFDEGGGSSGQQAPNRVGGHFDHDPSVGNEVFVSCVLWDGTLWLTGTDICRIIKFRFEAFGRKIVNVNKFHEGIYSDLRNIKAGAGASCEEPKSALLQALFIYDCIQSAKRQKVFEWWPFPIAMHDSLFLDQLSREYEREVRYEALCTVAVREPALSFRFNAYMTLPEQLGLPNYETSRAAPLQRSRTSQRQSPQQSPINEAVLDALALGP